MPLLLYILELIMSKKVVRYLIYILLVCVFAIFVFKLNQTEKTELVVRTGQTFEKAEVTEILQDNLDSNGTRVGEQKVRVKMLTGARKGEELDITSSSGYLFGAACKVGMKVIVMQSVAGETTIASVYSQDREWVIYIFALLYLLALCVIGGKQGIKGCLGLIFTFFCVIFVYLPLVYLRFSPFWAAVFICFLTTLVTMYLINRIQVGGLLFSGLLISCLGAVMDVAMSISSAIDEIYKQNTSLTRKELFKAGMRVGRDMMGTDSNTLILAFAGSSVSTLLLDYAYDLPYQQIINSNNIGIAIMQGLAGSFGIVLSVPLTVLICTVLFHKNEAVSQV